MSRDFLRFSVDRTTVARLGIQRYGVDADGQVKCVRRLDRPSFDAGAAKARHGVHVGIVGLPDAALLPVSGALHLHLAPFIVTAVIVHAVVEAHFVRLRRLWARSGKVCSSIRRKLLSSEGKARLKIIRMEDM